MVSRRKILSRSRDDLNLDQTFSPQEEEEDVWYQKEKLYKEHIQEVLDKWTQIDDEIWAKVIVFERNRRVAKAYARAPVLTINGSDDGFDGMRIGLCGFDNPMRDQKTEELKKHIGQGVKIKMDDAGNILIRRYAKSNVYIKSTASNPNEETSIGGDILKLPNQALESEKIVKLFDMKKFQSNVNRELRRAYPDRRRLETQCLSAVAFVKSESDILECPIWVLIVNVVAMDMLKSKLPPVQRPIVDIKNRPRIPIPDEDPYSVAGNGSGGSSGSSGFGASAMSSMMSLQQQQQLLQQQQQSQSMTGNNNGNGSIITTNGNGNNNVLQHLNNGMVAGMNGSGHVAATREQLIMQSQQLAHKRSEKPPKLPPRDNVYGHDIPKPDYDDIEVDTRIKLSRGKSDKGKDNKKYDDPYYCGLRARVPNFVKSSSKSAKDNAALQNGAVTQQQPQHMNTLTSQKKNSIMMPMHPIMHAPAPPHMHPQHLQQQQMMAAVAAHAVAQQQQHPMHHHHVQHAAATAAAAQQMWQTRSYESGIGIYNHNTTLTTATAATTATATNFHNNNTDLQQQQQQQQQHNQASTAYYPSTNASSSLYNYLAPNYQEHLQSQQMLVHQQHQQQQQQQQHNIVNSSSSTTATAITSPLSNSSNLLPAATQSMPAIANGLAPSTSIQLSTNLTFNTNPSIETQKTKPSENIYGQTRNLNIKHSTPTTTHHNHVHNTKNGHQHHHHHHHSHYNHHHQHRRHHHGSYGCLMHTPHSVTRHNAGECRYKKTHEIDEFDDFNHRSHNRHFRASRRSSSATAQPDNNCNCVSCYTLAPLFGVPTPKRPPRSLSQQQLRQHQRLSGAKTGYSNVLKRGVVKWCSDSDVSLLGREEWEQTEPSDDYSPYAKYANRKTDDRYYDAAYDQNDFNFYQDFDIENFTLSQMDYKKQLQKPRASAKFNGFAVRHKYSAKETQQPLTDDYVDKARLRQIRSPTPKRKESHVRDSHTRQHLNSTTVNDTNKQTNLLTMRNKSQSTESFFEQPHEEGPIYLYGGRKRIVKAPSTTNIYDRVKNHNDLYLNSNPNPYNLLEQRKNSDHDTIRPLVPPPLWRGAKRMNLKAITKSKLNNQHQQQQQQQILDQNNNPLNIISTRQNTKINNNLYNKTEESNQMPSPTTTNTTTANALATSTNNNNKTSMLTNTSSHQKQMEHHNQHQQHQQQLTQRIGRPSSRNDFSDMESIYGYLKPRKPRSLSMKKIHILDY